MKIKRELLNQIIKFVIVGGIATVIDYVVMVFCKEVVNLSTLLSAFLGFSISVIYNYIASIKWVFNVDETKNKKKNFILFIVFSLIGLLITEILLYIGEEKLSINYLIVKVFSTCVVMIFNFITRKLFLE